MPIDQISPAALAEQLKGPVEQRPLLLDVRFAEEYQQVSLPNAVLIPLPELQERIEELTPFKNRAMVVYCHHGVRSLNGAAFLQDQGYQVASLSGGIDRYSLEVDPRLPRY